MPSLPWKCGKCGQRAVVPVVIPYEADVEHDGRAYRLVFPDLSVQRCERCGTIILDDAAGDRISAALRREAGLLTPEDILAHRQARRLTQKQLAGCLGIAEATLSRWETGAQIQQRCLDRFLRVLFAFPSVRAVLSRPAPPQPETGTNPRFRSVPVTPKLLDRAHRFALRRAAAPEPAKEENSVPAASLGTLTK